MNKFKSTHVLSIIIGILIFIASAGGFFIDNLYRDNNTFILSAWLGNDLVTLFLALPLFLGALIFYAKGSRRAHLIWLGMLYYCIYNFSYYLFGAAFNWFFPIYVALFVLGIFTLIFGIIELDINKVEKLIKGKSHLKFVSIYMSFMSGSLAMVWIGQWLNFVLTGNLPEIIAATGGSTNLIAIMDLSFIVSVGILASIWLWQRRIWGYVLSVIFNVNGAVYTVVLIAGCFAQDKSGVKGAFDLLFLWIFFSAGCLISILYLLKNSSESLKQLNL